LPVIPGQRERKDRSDEGRPGEEIIRKGLEWLLGR